jgi:2-iminobutanoate/2-iminopropanoate deaminase
MPAGIRAGRLIYCGHITGADPATGELPESTEAQIEHAFAAMRSLVDRAGATLDNIARVSLFLARPADLQIANTHWSAMFPKSDDRPTYKFMTVRHSPGQQIELDFIAVAGGRRTTLAIEGVAHTNPIPLAVKIGPMLFSSRILPADPALGAYADTPERQAELVFQHAATLVDLAGGVPQHICQVRAFLKEPSFKSTLDAPWRALFPDQAHQPFLELTHYPTPGPLQIMIEIIADGLPEN